MEFEHKVGALDDEDLVVVDKEERNWKAIVIALLVIDSVLGAIIIAINQLQTNGELDTNKMKLDFDHMASDMFQVQSFNGAWLNDRELVYVDPNGSIAVLDAERNLSSTTLVKTYDKTLHTMSGFKLSADRQRILFVSDVRREFGAVVSARYAIFNVSSQTVEYLEDIVRSNFPARPLSINFAAWSPDGLSIVFVESNDIHLVTFAASNNNNRLTTTAHKYQRLSRSGGMSDSIRNGVPDGLYRSSIFTEPDEATIWWSASGRHLAYLSFDDAQVEQSPIEFYDSYMHSGNDNPKIHFERYPRAGGLNPRVSVHVVDVEVAHSPVVVIAPPAELVEQQQLDARMGHYVTHVDWLPGDHLLVLWANRAQNSSVLTLCDSPINNKTSPVESSSLFGFSGPAPADGLVGGPRQAWQCETLSTFARRVPPNTNAKRTILSTADASGARLVFLVLPRPDSVIGDHMHVALIKAEERAPKYLTHGEFDVDRLVRYDAQTDSLYFEALESDKAERHLFRMSAVAQVATRQTLCVTCELADDTCGYSHTFVSLGANPKYFVHDCLGPSVPNTRLRLLSGGGVVGGSGSISHLLGANALIEQQVRSRQMPIEKLVAIKSNSQLPYDVHIKLYLPSEVEDEKDKRFPLLIESSEIDRRKVWKKFDMDYGKYLASRKQLIYARIDCVRSNSRSAGAAASAPAQPAVSTGSGGEFYSPAAAPAPAPVSVSVSSATSPVSATAAPATHNYHNHPPAAADSPLLNAKHQVDVIKFLVENAELFPYIDRHRIAIWGPTSTSAYVALATTINDDSRLIQCTVAVSPITNWSYMSSYLAEHFLGLPWAAANNLMYERSNLLKRSYEFLTRKLLIVHGTADEQVHVQHSMQFIKSLTETHMTGGSIHQMQLYPDVGHSLDAVRRHYFLTLDGFIDRCFYQKPITIKATEWKGKMRPKMYET